MSSDETIAKLFHDTYERLAPNYGYETRDETAVSWEDVPEPNRSLMLAVAGVVRASVVAELVSAAGRPTARSTPAFVRGWDAALTAISRTAGGNTR